MGLKKIGNQNVPIKKNVATVCCASPITPSAIATNHENLVRTIEQRARQMHPSTYA